MQHKPDIRKGRSHKGLRKVWATEKIPWVQEPTKINSNTKAGTQGTEKRTYIVFLLNKPDFYFSQFLCEEMQSFVVVNI